MQGRWLRSRLPKKFTSNHHKHVFLQSSPDILRAGAPPDLRSAQGSPAQTPKKLKPVSLSNFLCWVFTSREILHGIHPGQGPETEGNCMGTPGRP